MWEMHGWRKGNSKIQEVKQSWLGASLDIGSEVDGAVGFTINYRFLL